MFETLIVIGIVVIAGVMAGRSFYRTMADKNNRCGCTGDCHSCTIRIWQKGAGTGDRSGWTLTKDLEDIHRSRRRYPGHNIKR